MAAVTIALFLGVRAALVSQFDATLRARLATLQAATRWDGKQVGLDYVSDAMPWYQPGPGAEYFEVRMAPSSPRHGEVVARSPSLGGAELDVQAEGQAAWRDQRLPDGRWGRLATQLFNPPPDETLDVPGKEAERANAVATTPTVSVAVAMSRVHLDAALRTIGLALVLAGAVMAVGLVIGVRLALGAGLDPLRNLSAQVEQIRPDTLSARLPGDDLPDELRPIHTRLNELIERLEVAFARERRFASAAAHELRTPVAELRSLLEVSMTRPRTPENARGTMEDGLRITLRMESLVRSLLAMARQPAANGALPPSTALHPILLRSVQRLEPAALARAGSLDCTGGEDCMVNADEAALESVLFNVLSNAVEYSDPVPTVRCEVHADRPGYIRIDVTNPARGITREHLARFFEPFWRRSASRTDQSHLGLGLAVARALAEGMGGEVSVDLDEDQIVRTRIVLREAPGVPRLSGPLAVAP
jgi:signal transduction histidine kinase